MHDANISATLVWDGDFNASPVIPPDLMPPKGFWCIKDAGQFEGTPAEQVIEIAGRCCYDSFGKGRPSAEYHAHLLKVKHWSVHEHVNLTAELPTTGAWYMGLCSRPGVHLRYIRENELRVTFNLRVLLDWDTHTVDKLRDLAELSDRDNAIRLMAEQYQILSFIAHEKVPSLIPDPKVWIDPSKLLSLRLRAVEPACDRERFVTLFLTGSRGLTHELVRHRHQMAFSQRSTRYVDEDQTPWVMHPLITSTVGGSEGDDLLPTFNHTVKHARSAYTTLVDQLQKVLLGNEVDKLTARKQARGAARGLLGNALRTEIVVTASVAQWQHMLRLRCSPFADAEIRVLFGQVLRELRKSRWGYSFADYDVKPSPDGIGTVLDF